MSVEGGPGRVEVDSIIALVRAYLVSSSAGVEGQDWLGLCNRGITSRRGRRWQTDAREWQCVRGGSHVECQEEESTLNERHQSIFASFPGRKPLSTMTCRAALRRSRRHAGGRGVMGHGRTWRVLEHRTIDIWCFWEPTRLRCRAALRSWISPTRHCFTDRCAGGVGGPRKRNEKTVEKHQAKITHDGPPWRSKKKPTTLSLCSRDLRFHVRERICRPLFAPTTMRRLRRGKGSMATPRLEPAQENRESSRLSGYVWTNQSS